MKVSPVSDNALLFELGSEISESLTAIVAALSSNVERELGEVLVDLIPSYTTLLCVYDPGKANYLTVLNRLEPLLRQVPQPMPVSLSAKPIEIPVWYDPEVGYDLVAMSEQKQISIESLVERHCAKEYRVFAMGFMPGFAFMGRVEEGLATPRQATPRKAVAAGSVGIADVQTAVYPQRSPGGWNIIGRSPTAFFDATRGDQNAALLNVGDSVRFKSIDRDTFIEMGGNLG